MLYEWRPIHCKGASPRIAFVLPPAMTAAADKVGSNAHKPGYAPRSSNRVTLAKMPTRPTQAIAGSTLEGKRLRCAEAAARSPPVASCQIRASVLKNAYG